jgi:putative membrane protein
MSQLSPRWLATVAAVSGLAWACAGNQKPVESPQDEAAESAPVMKTTPPAVDDSVPAPNGQPAGMPPSDPPPQSSNGSSPTNALGAPGAGTPRTDASLSEAQIARIAELANTAEIEQGNVARTKAKDARVKAFAAKMVKHHGQAKTEQARLVRKLDLRSEDSPRAAALKSEGDATLASLKSATGAGFDVAYIDSQVTAHEKVLSTIDEQLMPSAKSESVVSALRVAREAVAAHLEEAKGLQRELSTASK